MKDGNDVSKVIAVSEEPDPVSDEAADIVEEIAVVSEDAVTAGDCSCAESAEEVVTAVEGGAKADDDVTDDVGRDGVVVVAVTRDAVVVVEGVEVAAVKALESVDVCKDNYKKNLCMRRYKFSTVVSRYSSKGSWD